MGFHTRIARSFRSGRLIWIVWLAGVLAFFAALQWAAPAAQASQPRQEATPVPALNATLSKTVGVQPGVCGTATALNVAPGATVYYCYGLQNTGSVAIDPQDLIDNLPGSPSPVAYTRPAEPLAPGAILTPTADNGLIRAVVINASENGLYASWGLLAADGSGTLQVQSNPTSVIATTLNLQAVLTVGATNSPCPATVTLALTSYQTRAYLCVAITNGSSVTLTNYVVSVPDFGINNLALTGTTGLQGTASAQLTVTAAAAPTLGVLLTVPSTTTRAYVTGTVSGGGQTVSTVTNQVKITGPAPQVSIVKYVITDPNATDCPSAATTVTASSNDQVYYYCLVLNNPTSLSYTVHHFTESGLDIDAAFNYALGPGQRITLTNATLPTFSVGPVLGPITATQNVYSTMYYTAGNPAGNFFAASQASSSIVAPTRAPTSTRQPTPTFTEIGGVTPTPTWTLTPIPASPTPSPTWTPSATPTPSPTVLVFSTPGGQAPTPYPPLMAGSQPAQPQPQPQPNGFVSPLDPMAAATATALAMQGQFPTPVLDPFGATATAVAMQGQLPTPVLDPFGATATAMAMQQFNPQVASPLETPTQPFSPLEPAPTPQELPTPLPEPPTPTPAEAAVIPSPALVITVTATPTPEASLAPTQRPIQPPTPQPPADGRSFFVRVLDSAGATLALLWFLAGSLLFFVTAGVLAGMSFRSKERERYLLSEGEQAQYRAEPAPQASPSAPAEDWPESLP